MFVLNKHRHKQQIIQTIFRPSELIRNFKAFFRFQRFMRKGTDGKGTFKATFDVKDNMQSPAINKQDIKYSYTDPVPKLVPRDYEQLIK